ncbi:MAG: MFS transporter [Gammaproteobacteria bacterium]|nr:MFS transporter [Gammaproteobacteria bacterium]MBT6246808.1 MFS transporter [Gammaproteobacteria bacterium]
MSGLLGLAIVMAMASLMNGSIWILYTVYRLFAFLGAGTIPVTWTRAVTTIFYQQRGLALGIMLSGTGICAIVIPQYTAWLISEYGWRGAYLGLAVLPLAVAGPLVYWFICFFILEKKCWRHRSRARRSPKALPSVTL